MEAGRVGILKGFIKRGIFALHSPIKMVATINNRYLREIMYLESYARTTM